MDTRRASPRQRGGHCPASARKRGRLCLGWAAIYGACRRDSYRIAAYFKETQLRHISTGDTAINSLMENEDLPFRGTVRSVGWGIFVPDGSSGQGTALLPSVSPTIDWVRLSQRFPVRIQVDSSAPTELRIGQTASVAISHGARMENTRIPE